MFANAAKPQTRASPDQADLAPQRLRPVERPSGVAGVGQAPMLRRSNQAALRRLAGRDGGLPVDMQPKLAVGRRDDPLEREADRTADQVMSLRGGRPSITAAAPQVSRACAGCEEKEAGTLQAKPATAPGPAHAHAPAVVNQVLASPGRPLDAGTRSFMERRFGQGFQDVRIHTDARAAQSASAVEALAYTVGPNVVFGAGQYDPESPRGRRLLAHELTHVAQQKSAPQAQLLQRFDVVEVGKIAPTFPDILAQIKKLIDDATTNGVLDWDFLVEISGGSSAMRKIKKTMHDKVKSIDPEATIPSRLFKRYIFTCRCGLIDMRHFLQLLYISQFSAGVSQSEGRGNRAATRKGREHELEPRDSESRFAAEDTPSNALGAATNLSLPAIPSPDKVYGAIKDNLTRCDPLGWSGLSAASKDQILHFYGDRAPDPTSPGDQVPKNQNQTAVPNILPVAECGGKERSFPFTLDTEDSDRKTLGGKAFDKGSAGLTSDSEIRDFVSVQRPELLQSLPAAEKVRLSVRLMQGWVSDDDLYALEAIYRSGTAAEQEQIRKVVNPDDLNSTAQRTRLNKLFKP